MRVWSLPAFGLESLRLESRAEIEPGPGEVRVRMAYASLNYRDLLVVMGRYDSRMPLPMTPLSDGAGRITAIGPGVTDFAVGDPVVTHYAVPWTQGPFPAGVLSGTLGGPGPGVAAEEVVLPRNAVLRPPNQLTLEEAATLPIAALTAWSCLVTEGGVRPGDTVVTLGTGGVSSFVIQLGTSLGARVLVTSSSQEKIARAIAIGAAGGVDYVAEPRWDRSILELTNRRGADLVVDNGGVGTLSRSLRAVRPGGIVALPGALTGLEGVVDIAPILMKRVRVAGIFSDSRAVFLDLVRHIDAHPLRPVISDRFPLEGLPDALRHLQGGRHFGKITLAVAP